MRTCPNCGNEIAGMDVGGLCPACVAKTGFALGLEVPTIPETEMAPQSRRLGDYELLEEIARGGMGVVYKARQISLNRTVAVKLILTGQLASAAEVQRFRTEAEAAANLAHPNIVTIHEIGQHEGQHFFSMAYVEGRNLAQFMVEVGFAEVDFRRAASWVKTLAEAIHWAHQRGILHRDLKPSNILIDREGQPHITDFGLAKRLGSESDLTVTGQIIGTPNFMAPEQAAGRRVEVGPRSDIYSLGAILYFLLTGRPAFQAETPHQTIERMLHAEPVWPRRFNPAVPRDLEVICLKCLEKEPRRRYGSGAELADDLGRFLAGESIQAKPLGSLWRLWRLAMRHRAVTVLSAALVVALITAFASWRRSMTSGPGAESAAEFDRPIAEMATRSAQGVLGVIDGKVYVTSPQIGISHVVSRRFDVYDPRANTWKRLADTLVSHSSGAGGVIAGKLYIAGGNIENSASPSNVVEAYDTVSNTWRQRASMPTARAACAAAVLGGRLYILGGYDGAKDVADVESYDPATDTWKSEPQMPIARSSCGGVVINGAIFLAAGRTDAQNQGAETIAVRSPDGQWSTTTEPMPEPASHAFVCASDGVIYVAGGTTGVGATTALRYYDVPRHSWGRLTSMPEVRYYGSGSAVIDGCLYVFGGWDDLPAVGRLPHADVFCFDLRKNRWRRSVPKPDGG